ncbi:MAG: hypothetical protein HXK17_04730, partial [Alloprevotella sp.]|nr:hypothetical protein [Alloprevotella sp.]
LPSICPALTTTSDIFCSLALVSVESEAAVVAVRVVSLGWFGTGTNAA